MTERKAMTPTIIANPSASLRLAGSTGITGKITPTATYEDVRATPIAATTTRR
ncbi:MAG: hypothetical protein OEQ47_16600 [Acidimicrobiia bacterium]|nr:hypothetical protein [Acidimicrobiia bacterium]